MCKAWLYRVRFTYQVKRTQHHQLGDLGSFNLINLVTEQCFVEQWYFVTKFVMTCCEKKKVLIIDKNFLRSLEQFIQTVKGQKIRLLHYLEIFFVTFWTKIY